MDIKQRMRVEQIFYTIAFLTFLAVMVLMLVGIASLVHMLGSLMLLLAAWLFKLERQVDAIDIAYHEVRVSHNSNTNVWQFRIGNNTCFLEKEETEKIRGFLDKTFNLTSDTIPF
jgi:hypothetical protein